MTTKLRAHFDGKVLVLDQPADLPTGTPLEIEVRLEVDAQHAQPTDRQRGILADVADWVETLPKDPNSPGDAAAQHDHYLYGTPKRDNP
jgi:hypothetical protein